METVPAHLAILAVREDAAALQALGSAGRKVGAMFEVDLDTLTSKGFGAASERVREYAASCKTFWEHYEKGYSTGPYVAIRRTLLHEQQKNTKVEKRDLVPQLEALDQIPGVDAVIKELTEGSVDLDKVLDLGAPFNIEVVQDGAWTNAVFYVEGTHFWDGALGGAASHAEVRRVFTVRSSQAAWRDRRNRRLAEVKIQAEEIWPDPAN